MNIEEVKAVIRNSLGLEDGVEIDSEVSLEVLGAEKIDFADILFKLEAYDVRDFSDGEFSKRGRDTLANVGISSGDYHCFVRFYWMSVSPSDEVFESLTPTDIYHIVNYKRSVAA